MVIKSKRDDDFLADIEETLKWFRRTNMKLNPKKCMFGMQKGKFLGHVIITTRIEANLEKVEALQKARTQKMVKDI